MKFGFFGEEKFPNVNWFCDNCNDYINIQDGFNDNCGEWTCTKCGHVNSISSDQIIDINEDQYEDSTELDESLNVWDAADIYFSNGCDEDYMFGFSHEELEQAFND